MERSTVIVNIPIADIIPHPDNPRKDLGDISELAESIKKNGIMQNLTVIPVDESIPRSKRQQYMAIIGHRRCAAAKAAGLTEVPCRIIRGMTHKEQVATMLEENMQRNDLTIWEQAKGFQMMLDLGTSEEDLCEKTGFSRSTIRHRLQLAKLDNEVLKKRETDECFQLSLTDLYELEKIPDVDRRNKLLEEARDSRDLAWRIKQAVAADFREKNIKLLKEKMKLLGIKAAPKAVENERWSGKWDTVKAIDLSKEVPEEIKLPCNVSEFTYTVWYQEFTIIKPRKEEKKVLSDAELEAKARDKARKEILGEAKELVKRSHTFVKAIVKGEIEDISKTDEEILIKAAWSLLVDIEGYVSMSRLVWMGTDFMGMYAVPEEEKQEVFQELKKKSMMHQLLMQLAHIIVENNKGVANWRGEYDESVGEKLGRYFDILTYWGWTMTDEEDKIIYGADERYVKNN